jgi:hypothetical protein
MDYTSGGASGGGAIFAALNAVAATEYELVWSEWSRTSCRQLNTSVGGIEWVVNLKCNVSMCQQPKLFDHRQRMLQ